MRFLVAVVALALVALCPAAEKKSKKGAPEVQIINLKLRRDAGVLTFEGKVKNIGERPIKGIQLYLEFLDPSGQMILKTTAQVTEDEVAPGDDSEFGSQTPDPPRAVSARLEAEDTQGRYLKLDKPGPHVIE
ncbi:MAG: hypothetical protein JSR81_10335 [Proteobacteria bacterium]|nr:hypothetical protein [Pseudomonadota bacterium]